VIGRSLVSLAVLWPLLPILADNLILQDGSSYRTFSGASNGQVGLVEGQGVLLRLLR
jgi:hypothetical protein